jgi:hypothetical protein
MHLDIDTLLTRAQADLASGRKARGARGDVDPVYAPIARYVAAVRESVAFIVTDGDASPLVRANRARAVGGFARDLAGYAARNARLTSGEDGGEDDSDDVGLQVIAYPIALRSLVREVAAVASTLPMSAADSAALAAVIAATPDHGVRWAGGLVVCNLCGCVHKPKPRQVTVVWRYDAAKEEWLTSTRNAVTPVVHPSAAVDSPIDGQRWTGKRWDVQPRCTTCSNVVAPAGAGLQ